MELPSLWKIIEFFDALYPKYRKDTKLLRDVYLVTIALTPTVYKDFFSSLPHGVSASSDSFESEDASLSWG